MSTEEQDEMDIVEGILLQANKQKQEIKNQQKELRLAIESATFYQDSLDPDDEREFQKYADLGTQIEEFRDRLKKMRLIERSYSVNIKGVRLYLKKLNKQRRKH